MQNLIINVLLSIERNWHNNKTWNLCRWRNDINFSVCKVFGSNLLLNMSIPYSDIAGSVLSKAFTNKFRKCASFNRSLIRRDWPYLWINVVIKLYFRIENFFTIECDGKQIERSNRSACTSITEGSLLLERRRITLHDIIFHNCSIHIDCLVPNAFHLTESHIDKVLSKDCDLCVTWDRSASRIDLTNKWIFIIKILNCFWWWVLFTLVSYCQRDITWFWNRWGHTEDFISI